MTLKYPQTGSLIVNLTFFGFSMFLHKMCVFLSKGTCPQIPGTHFLGKKKRLRQDCWGYGPCKNDLKIDGIV